MGSATTILTDYARQEAARKRNDEIFNDEWAAAQARKMGVEQMLAYVFTPNSSTLETAIRNRLRGFIGRD